MSNTAAPENPWLVFGLVIVFLVAVIVSMISTWYMSGIYKRSTQPRSWFFRMMLNSSKIKVTCGLYLGYETSTLLLNPVLTRLFGLVMPRIPPEINQPALLVIAIILVSPPIYYANTIRMVRKRGVYDPEAVLADRTGEGPDHVAERIDGGNDVMPPREANDGQERQS